MKIQVEVGVMWSQAEGPQGLQQTAGPGDEPGPDSPTPTPSGPGASMRTTLPYLDHRCLVSRTGRG